MPQNAVIATVGGDYPTVFDWLQGEKNSNYGAPTRSYISGVVQAGSTIPNFASTASSNTEWPNGIELYALPGQEFTGNNSDTCATITDSKSTLLFGDVDFDIRGIAIKLTTAYNAECIATSPSKVLTRRRNIKLKNLYLEGAQYFHGASNVIEIGTSALGNNKYDLAIENIVVYPRASTRGFSVTATVLTENFTGFIRDITILPTNSGTTANAGFMMSNGDSCPSLAISSILSLGSEVRTTYVDFDVAPAFGGTLSNLVSRDTTGQITGKTTTTELENYASKDFRLKASSLGFGAFKQEESSEDGTITNLNTSVTVIGSLNQTILDTLSSGANYSLFTKATANSAIYDSIASQAYTINTVIEEFASAIYDSMASRVHAVNTVSGVFTSEVLDIAASQMLESVTATGSFGIHISDSISSLVAGKTNAFGLFNTSSYSDGSASEYFTVFMGTVVASAIANTMIVDNLSSVITGTATTTGVATTTIADYSGSEAQAVALASTVANSQIQDSLNSGFATSTTATNQILVDIADSLSSVFSIGSTVLGNMITYTYTEGGPVSVYSQAHEILVSTGSLNIGITDYLSTSMSYSVTAVGYMDGSGSYTPVGGVPIVILTIAGQELAKPFVITQPIIAVNNLGNREIW